MEFQYSPYAVSLFIAALVTVGLTWYALRHRKRDEALAFSLMMACLSWWSIFYGLSMMGANFETAYLFNRLKYIGVMATPPLWFILALQYTQRQSVLTRRNLLLIFLPTILLLPLVLTDHYFHLWWKGPYLGEFGGQSAFMKEGHTWFYYAHIATSYFYVLSGLWLYVRFHWQQPVIYRAQTNLMIIAGAVPLVASIITQLEMFSFPWALDSFFFTLSGGLFAVAIFRYGYLDIMPIARRVIVEQMPNGVIVINSEERIVDANPIAQHIIGQAGDLIVGQPLLESIRHPRLRDALSDLLRERPLEEMACDVRIDATGQARTLAMRVTPLMRDGGRKIGHIVLLRDVSERVKAQRQLEALYREAELERKRLASTIASASEPIALLDMQGRILSSNPAAQRVLQAQHRDSFPDVIRSAITSAHWTKDEVRTEIEIDEQHFHVHIAPIAKRGGLVLTMHDVTHFKRLAHLKDDFVATVSHDLRTPLSAILGYAQIAKLDNTPEQERRHALERVEANVAQMNHLINDLLHLAKLEMDVAEKQDWVKMDRLVQEVVQMLEGAAIAKGLMIQFDLNDTPPMMLSRRLFFKVWSNLIDNAIKYTEEGTITVELKTKGNQVIGRVGDTGVGIPPADLPYVFDKFYRASSPYVKRIEGTGLGLALVKSIVKKHGGRVWVESELGVGSTFTLVLPRDREPEVKDRAHRTLALLDDAGPYETG